MNYDLIVVGGGIAGSSLARRMAAHGAKVLVLERETEFRDRIRGEALAPWGVAEARKLGVAETLEPAAAALRWFEQSIDGERAFRRDLMATTMSGQPMWGIYHPDMQEKLLTQAAASGADVRRGATVQQVLPGRRPKVIVDGDGQAAEFEARSKRASWFSVPVAIRRCAPNLAFRCNVVPFPCCSAAFGSLSFQLRSITP